MINLTQTATRDGDDDQSWCFVDAPSRSGRSGRAVKLRQVLDAPLNRNTGVGVRPRSRHPTRTRPNHQGGGEAAVLINGLAATDDYMASEAG